MRQAGLHLERGAQSALRGPDRHAVAGNGAQSVLRDGGGKARKGCGSKTDPGRVRGVANEPNEKAARRRLSVTTYAVS